jgi:hypothetical protein
MRNDYVPCHKYDTPFTAYLDEKVVGNSGQDEETGDIESSYGSIVRVGRHLLTYSTTGFVDRDTYANAKDASFRFDSIKEAYDYLLDEES